MKKEKNSSFAKNLDYRKLMNRVTIKRIVNLHFNESSTKDSDIKKIVERIAKRNKGYFVDVDIELLRIAEDEATDKLIEIINEDLSKRKFKHWIHEGISIDHVLNQLNENLEKPALIIFHQFKDTESEEEKIILTGIRKFIQMRDSLLLGILIISSREVGEWDLSPYSPLNEDYVEYFPYNPSQPVE